MRDLPWSPGEVSVSVCPGCGTPGQHEGARFCFSCGYLLQAPGCGSCGFELAPGSRFCPSCGTAQAGAPAPPPPQVAHQPVASRRITSVLFGDLVGFTALSETRDQEDVRELLSNYFESCSQVVARYGGTVEKFIGDAVMAVWGVPTTHEDDAERAVRAGLELVNLITALGADLGVPDLAMRVGIVTGEVAVTVGATQQGMVAGDAVNTAARVQTAAAPGQVWVDETTRLLTSSAVTYVDVGSHAMKGKADPMPLWAVRAIVAGVGGSQRADGLEAPHIGRDRELRLVKEIFHGVEETKRPTLVLVSGEAGVGKSRLGWEFDKYTDGLSSTTWWHHGRCLSYGEGVAFFALAEAIRVRLQHLCADHDEAADTATDQTELLETGLLSLVPDENERAWMQPRLGALLGVNAVGAYQREDLFAAWTTFLQRVSGSGDPVVLLIDDAQHADDGLLDFVEHLLAVGTFPCFVMLLARPSLLEGRPTLATNRRSHVMHLEVLSPGDMSALFDGLVVGLPDRTRDALIERAEGIPLYAVETVRSLIDRDLVVPRGGQYVLANATSLDLDNIAAPASLQALIAARLDTLPTDQRRVIDQASVLGNSFTREAIEGLCPDLPDLDGALGQLVRLQLFSQEASRFSAERGQYRFVQSAVRHVAYGTLSRHDRKASHLLAVRQLESSADLSDELSPIIAQHYLEALDAVPDAPDRQELTDAAIRRLRQAAERASALGAPAEAAGHLRSALARSEDVRAQATIELELAQQLKMQGDLESAMAHSTSALEAFDRLDEPISAASAAAVLSHALWYRSRDVDGAIEMVRARLDTVRGLDDAHRVQLELLRVLIGCKLDTGQDFGEETFEKLRFAELVGDDSEMADAYVSLALHCGRSGAISISRTILESAAEIAQRNHDRLMRTRVLVNLNALWTNEDTAKAVEIGREASREASALGDASWTSIAFINLALGLLLEGEWSEAADLMDQDVSWGTDQPYTELISSYIAVSGGRPAGVEDPAATPLEDADVATAVNAFRLLRRAVVTAVAGEPSAARLAVEAVTMVHDVTQIVDDFATVLALAAEVVVRLEDREALAQLNAVVDAHHPGTHPRGVRALRTHHRGLEAIWDGAEPDVVEQHLRTALAEAGAWGSGLVQARIAADLGVWLTRQGRSGDATGLVEQARTLFTRMGATVQLGELDTRLGAVSHA